MDCIMNPGLYFTKIHFMLHHHHWNGNLLKDSHDVFKHFDSPVATN